MSNFPGEGKLGFFLVCASGSMLDLWSSNWDWTRIPCGLVAKQLIGVVLGYGPE